MWDIFGFPFLFFKFWNIPGMKPRGQVATSLAARYCVNLKLAVAGALRFQFHH
jgi:hypothetical protein